MKIIDLKKDYPKVYDAALRNQKLQSLPECDEIELICEEQRLDLPESETQNSFDFSIAVESENFWDLVADGCFDSAKLECPYLFDEVSINVIASKSRVWCAVTNDLGQTTIYTGVVESAKIDSLNQVFYKVICCFSEFEVHSNYVYSNFTAFNNHLTSIIEKL